MTPQPVRASCVASPWHEFAHAEVRLARLQPALHEVLQMRGIELFALRDL